MVDQTQTTTDELDDTQLGLDAEQGIQAPPVYATAADVERIIASQLKNFEVQVRGLQSKVDSSATAIRRDLTNMTTSELAKIRQELKQKQILEAIPEEHREWMGAVLNQVMDQDSPQAPSVPVPVQTPQVQQEMMQAMDIIRRMGGDPQNPMINYAAYLQGDNDSFLASIGASFRNAPAPAAPKPAPAPARAQTTTPPVETPSGGTRTDLSRVDAVRDAYLTDKIDKKEYTERMARLGQPV